MYTYIHTSLKDNLKCRTLLNLCKTVSYPQVYSSSEDVEEVEEAGMLLNQFSLAPWSEDAGVPCNGVDLKQSIHVLIIIEYKNSN